LADAIQAFRLDRKADSEIWPYPLDEHNGGGRVMF